MVRADVFEGMNRFLQLARKNDLPFGGVQLCVIGDLFQLPPIVSREEKSFFGHYYSSPFFFAAPAYENADFQTVQFETIHRQNDPTFIHILNAIRAGNCSQTELEALNQRLSPRATPAPGTLVLTSTNALAETINDTQLARLPNTTQRYDGDVKGVCWHERCAPACSRTADFEGGRASDVCKK